MPLHLALINLILLQVFLNSLKEATYRLFDLNKEIHVIPNFIEIEDTAHLHEKSVCQRSVLANLNERIITHISNFRKVKNIPDVVKVFYNDSKRNSI